jgi:transcriptional repressor OPI1
MSAQQQERPPLHELPAYSSLQFHDHNTLDLPSVPSIDPLPPRRAALSTAETLRQTKPALSPPTKPLQQPQQRSLSIKDLISSPPVERAQLQPQQQYFPVFPHQTLPPASSPVTNNSTDADLASSGDLESVVSASERSLRAGSVLSMEDPDVRIAAEALGDLRAGSFLRKSPPQNRSLLGLIRSIARFRGFSSSAADSACRAEPSWPRVRRNRWPIPA